MFFSDDLMKLMVTESNRCAEEIMGNEKFAKITLDEMKAFLGFLILMVINQLSAVRTIGRRVSTCTIAQLQTEYQEIDF